MKRDPRKWALIKELEIRADVMEKYHSDGWKFYDEVCKRNKVSCLEEMTAAQLAKEIERQYEHSDSNATSTKNE